ncbi:MAG: molybdopterin molybdotransferase MoeA [Thermoplasmata archaeon]
MGQHGGHHESDRGHGMRVFTKLMPLEKALAVAREATKPLKRVEGVPLERSVGRVLAQDVVSPVDVPAFDKAMMDGYAIRSQDVAAQGKALDVVGEAHPGEPHLGTVLSGEAVKTATGAPVPAGTDAVVEVELVEVQGSRVSVPQGLSPRRNVSPRGEDIGAGNLLLPAGSVLRPGRVGAVAALGVQELPVYARPRVAVLATGREIKRGGTLRPGEVYDVNSFTLTGLIREHGGSVELFDPIPDTYEAIRGAVARAENLDLVVLSGSTSVGERDFLRDATAELGEVLFHGVAMKPGKPLLLAKVGKGLVFGMPGFPASCLMAAYHFLLPVLRRMARHPEAPERRPAILGEDMPLKREKTQLVAVRREKGRAYRAFRGSGNITGISRGDGYVVIPPGQALKERDEIEVIDF